MPSLILTGHACTGKTTFAKLLRERALNHKSKLIQNVFIVNEQSARPDKTLRECYSTSTEEKLTRSALKNEFDMHVGKEKTLVVLDSMNYIKGFRYELHCISKASGGKHGVIWLICNEEVAKKWNEQRSEISNTGESGTSNDNDNQSKNEDCYYSEEMMEELMLRYEPPDQRNRWDRPLYRVDVNSTLDDNILGNLKLSNHTTNPNINDSAEEVLQKSVYNMHSLSEVIKDSSQSTVVTSTASNKIMGSSCRITTAATTTSTVTAPATTGSGFRRAAASKSGFQRAISSSSSSTRKKIESKHTYNNDTTTTSSFNIVEIKQNVNETSPTNTKRVIKKMENLIEEILDSFLLDVEPLKQGQSTQIPRSAATNLLHDVDSISQDVANMFLTAQQNQGGIGGGGKILIPIEVGKEPISIQVNKNIKAVELKRFRRQYVKWAKEHPPRDTSKIGIATSFLSFLENQL
mmetsp:Transcript_30388/g.35377  ORF Transcript_30388/g.35377 Transcript_30388/m.35377 type:complete len:463 (-) Transcript_30388:243-1631(-)